jgi:threonine synthase
MGYIADPHTAIAVKVAHDYADPEVPMVTLSTAHPAKFPDTVHDATGKTSHPPVWGDIPAERSETVAHLMNDRACVEAHILEHFFRAQKLINSTAKD